MNVETINPTGAIIQIAIAVVWLACVVVCFLKGKPWSAILGIAAAVADAFGPPTINGLYLFNPLITIFSFSRSSRIVSEYTALSRGIPADFALNS
jgi:hypothetical protein